MAQRPLNQVNRRMFGEYQCRNCNRMWTSANSWANYSQKCMNCHIDAYPLKQVPLEQSSEVDKSNPAKHHPKELCGKCRALGRFCGQNIAVRQYYQALPIREPGTPEEDDLTLFQKIVLFILALIAMYFIHGQPNTRK